jgi:pilus assembly protein CpaB
MQGRNWIVLAIAVVVGIFAVILANSYFSGVEERNEQLARQQAMVQIVVAAQPLEFGTKLTQQNIRLQTFPASSVPEGAFRTIPEALKDNRVALRPIVPNEPVLASKVSGTDGRATLAALLPEGMRATSVSVDAVRGVAGFVLPNTMVDVLLTRKIAGEGAGPEDIRSDVILENVQVLAIDQIASDKADKPKVSRTATLAVSLHDAQRLTIAQRVGTLSFALRKVETAANANPDGSAARFAHTVTGRQLGGPRMYIPARRAEAPRMAANNPPRAVAPSFRRAAYTGPVSTGGSSMTVIRGVEPTSYPVGYLGGF